MMHFITHFIPCIWDPTSPRINKKEEYNKIRDNIKDLQGFLEKLNKKIEHVKGLLIKRRLRYFRKIVEASSEAEERKLQSNTTHDIYTKHEEQVVLETNKQLRVIEEMIENQFEIIYSNTNKTDTLVLLEELLDIFKTNFNATEMYIFKEYRYIAFKYDRWYTANIKDDNIALKKLRRKHRSVFMQEYNDYYRSFEINMFPPVHHIKIKLRLQLIDYYVELENLNNSVEEHANKKELVCNIKKEIEQLERLLSTHEYIDDRLDELEIKMGVLQHKIDNTISNNPPPPRPDKSYLYDAERKCHVLRQLIEYIEDLKNSVQNNEQKPPAFKFLEDCPLYR